ncbi:MAG: hypothetical protein KDD75_13845, partial [Caldilineaceae bacterium]|nr:hypothetical protein [Caldilineaceae bacterium]
MHGTLDGDKRLRHPRILERTMFKWFADVFDVTLLATIGLIFFATLVGAYVRARRRDQCLKAFIGYNVTV